MKRYANYIFDFYGTLVDIKTDEDQPEVWEALANYFRRMGLSYNGPDLKRAYGELVEQALLEGSHNWAYPEFDVKEIFVQLAGAQEQQSSLSEEDLEAWVEDLATTFRRLSRQHLALYSHTKEVLDELKAAGARLFLLSNAQAAYTNAEIDEFGLRSYFDQIYLSSDYGMCKPQAEFLERVLADYDLDPKDSVMVGNDLTSDMAVALKVGIDGILLNTFPYNQEELADFHGPVIADIRGLLGDSDSKK